MKQLSSAQVRQMWLDFWASKGHSVEPSVSLVPVNIQPFCGLTQGLPLLRNTSTEPSNLKIHGLPMLKSHPYQRYRKRREDCPSPYHV